MHTLVEEEGCGIVDECKVPVNVSRCRPQSPSDLQEHAVASQAVTSVADQLDSSNRVVSAKSQQHIVVGKSSLLGLVESLRFPSSLDGVVVFVVADVDRIVHIVSDELCLDFELGILCRGKLLLDLLLLCQLLLLLK